MISYILISFISLSVTQDLHTTIICTMPVIWGQGSMNESAFSDFPTTRLCVVAARKKKRKKKKVPVATGKSRGVVKFQTTGHSLCIFSIIEKRLCLLSLHSSTHFKDKHTNCVTWLEGPQPTRQFQTRPTVSYSVHKCETKHANYRKTTCSLLKQQKLPKITLLLTVKPMLSFSEAVCPNC